MTQRRPSPLVLTYFILLFLGSMLMMLRLLWPFTSMLILSYFLSSIAKPVYDFLDRQMPSSLASLITCALIVLLVFVPLIFFVVALSSEAYHLLEVTKGTNIAETLSTYVQTNAIYIRLDNLLQGYGFQVEMGQITSALSEFGTTAAKFIYTQASIWAGNILNFILNFLMMILIIFFILIEREKLVNFLLHLSPLPNNHDLLLMDKFERIAGAILVGNGICGVIQGIFGGLAFAFLGFSSPILWGCIMGIMAFLPIIGIGAVLGPAALYLIIQGHLIQGLGLAIFYIILSMGVEYLLKPKLVGGQVQMHTILVFLSIIGGLAVFGILGIIYGPLIFTAFLTLSDIYIDNYERYITCENDEC
jgi:predicted PurR-regulated permease PerM